jgi:hypothetical protein
MFVLLLYELINMLMRMIILIQKTYRTETNGKSLIEIESVI